MDFWVLSIILFYVQITQSESVHKVLNKTDHNVLVNNLKNFIIDENWEEDELQCQKSMLTLLDGVQNGTLWATWLWDSNQLPVGSFYGSLYHMGSFDQCLQTPWPNSGIPMKYCLADIKLAEPGFEGDLDPFGPYEDYYKKGNKYERNIQKLSWGVCIPKACKTKSVIKILKNMNRLTHLRALNITINEDECQTKDIEIGIGFYVYWSCILLLFFIMLIATYGLNGEIDTLGKKILYCFCYKRNLSQLKKTSDNDIKVMNSIKTITCGIVICVHYMAYANLVGIINANDIDNAAASPGKYFMHIDVGIESFFVLSALLFVKNLMNNDRDPLKIFLKRWFRFIGPVVLVTLYIIFVFRHTESGPLWPRLTADLEATCVNNWWTTIFMISNYVNSDQICNLVSWYLSCDYQLAIMATIIFFICKKNKKLSVYILSSLFIASIIVNAVLTYVNKLPFHVAYRIDERVSLANNRLFSTNYTKSYIRFHGYLIGAVTGYMMAVYKPQDHRKIISKRTSNICVIIAIVLLIIPVTIGGFVLGEEYEPLKVAILAGTTRVIWGFGICLGVIITEYGYTPSVLNLFISDVFTPLSRLSFNCYLVHTIVSYHDLFSIRAPKTFGFLRSMIHGSGHFVFSGLISVIIWFLVEAPMCNLSNILFDTRKPAVTEGHNGKNIVNGTKAD